MQRRLTALLAITAATFALVPATYAGASPAGAVAPPIPVSVVPRHNTAQPHAELLGVSCSTNSSCIAVGRTITPGGLSAAVTERRGPAGTWRLAHTGAAAAGALTSVSCAGSTCFAVAHAVRPTGFVGQGPTRIVRRSGGHWVPTPMDAVTRSRVTDLSCARATSCVAVGSVTGRGTVTWTWDGSRWRVHRLRYPHRRQLAAVSCDAPGSCWAAGGRGPFARQDPLVLRLHHGTWRPVTLPTVAGHGTLDDISCAAGACTAVGAVRDHIVVTGNRGGSWVTRRPLPHLYASSGTAVSCTAHDGCTAVVSFLNGNEAVSTAIAHRAATGPFRLGPARRPALQAIDCRAAHCTVVGSTLVTDRGGNTLADVPTRPVTARSTGRALAPDDAAVPPGGEASGFDAVSCIPEGFCAAVDTTAAESGGEAVSVRRPGHRWHVSPGVVGPEAAISDIACTSATFCVVVGSSAAWMFDGSGWTRHVLPTRRTDEVVAVACAAPSACDAVGEVSPPGAGNYRPLDLHWNGTTWTRSVPAVGLTGNPVLTDVACGPGSATCVAVGDNGTRRFLEALGDGAPQFVTGHGPEWRATESRIACWSATGCVVAGSHGVAPGVASWDGTHLTATPFAGAGLSNPPEVDGLACADADRCTAAGIRYLHGRFVPLIETWDGHTWRFAAVGPLRGGGQQPSFSDVSCPAGQCTAVGLVYRQFTVAIAADYALA